MGLPNEIAGALVTDAALWREFIAICDCGGRVAGTPSERAGLALVTQFGQAATGCAPRVDPTPYDGWTCRAASLNAIENGRHVPLSCEPLLRSASGTVTAEVLPIGRGTEAEFAAAGDRLRGRIALVRHEYMFAAGHIHRRHKLAAAIAQGAVGFLIAGPLPAAAVAGGAGPELPALGISPEAAARLSPAQGPLARAEMRVEADHMAAVTDAIHFDLPGTGPDRVVLSAHIDGHAPGESAMDNATGVAVALAVARALAPHVATARRGLTLAFYSAEEWALTGSKIWLAGLSDAARRSIVLNVNLDSVVGGQSLTALTSGFPALGDFVRRVVPIGVHMPLMTNSDHANFAAHGIPALRLVSGFDEPGSALRHVLTAADTRDKVGKAALHHAAVTAAELVWAGLTAPDDAIAALA